jgi:hypothetical protein
MHNNMPAQPRRVRPHEPWLLVAGAILALVTAGCEQRESIWEAMVAFDQAYIPALSLTSEQKGKAAGAVMPQVEARWEALQERLPTDWRQQAAWERVAADVSGRLQRAEGRIAEGQLTEAHDELEAVRELLRRQRRAHGMEYFVDRLTAYHEPMEATVLAVKGKTAATLTDADVSAIRQHLQQAQTRWQKVEEAEVDPQRYRLSAAKGEALRAGIGQESAALRALQATLASGERQKIIQTAAALKPPFAELFKLFGDFSLVGG